MNIINLSESRIKNWPWLEKDFPQHKWQHIASHANLKFTSLPKHETINRAMATYKACRKARHDNTMLITHAHTLALMAGYASPTLCPGTPHIAYSVSFIDLPQGKQRKFAIKALKNVDKIVIYSTKQRQVLADHFEMPVERIDMLHWTEEVPTIDPNEQPIVAGRYFCALGSQGRDYKSLIEVMKTLPNINLVLVAAPEALEGIEVPDNLKVYSNIPMKDAKNILAHSEFTVLPLRDLHTASGHMTIVLSMLYKKTILTTFTETTFDYIKDHETGLYFEHQNLKDLKEKIESLWDNNQKTIQMNEAAYQFALANCTEQNTIDHLRQFISTHS